MSEIVNDEHDYYCDCAECTELMYSALDRLNATLAKFGPARATITGAKPRPNSGPTPEREQEARDE